MSYKTPETHYSVTELALLTGEKKKKLESIFSHIKKEEVKAWTRIDLADLKPFFPSMDLLQLHEEMKKTDKFPIVREHILRDPACIKKGDFTAKYSLLLRLLSEDSLKWFRTRWAAMADTKTDALRELKNHKSIVRGL